MTGLEMHRGPSAAQRLRRLPPEGYFLLLATLPLAGIFAWKFTVPLLVGEFGRSPPEVIVNFLGKIAALNRHLSLCPPVLSEEARAFWEGEDIVDLPQGSSEDMKHIHSIQRPLKGNFDRLIDKEEESCMQTFARMSTSDTTSISHWLTGKALQFKEVSDSFRSSSTPACVGGTFTISSNVFQKTLSHIEGLSTKHEGGDVITKQTRRRFIGTRATSLSQLTPTCQAQQLLQMCGTIEILVRYPLIEGDTYRWSKIFKGSLSEGHMLVLPALSVFKMQVESDVAASVLPLSVAELSGDPTSMVQKQQRDVNTSFVKIFVKDIKELTKTSVDEGLIKACTSYS